MHQNKNKNEICLCNTKSHFLKKLYMHNFQKELRMGTAWGVNKKGCCLISIGTEILLNFGYCVSHLAPRKKPYLSLLLLLVQSFIFFLLGLFFMSSLQISLYILTLFSIFFFWYLPLKSWYKRTHLVPTTISHWITGKYSWLNLKKPTIGGLLKSKPLHFHSSQRWWKKKK